MHGPEAVFCCRGEDGIHVQGGAAPNDGEYAVENLAAEPALSPAAEPRPAATVPLTAAAAVSGPAKAAADDSEEWSVEVLDTIASIPPWDPNGNLSDDAPAAPDSYETAGVLPVEPIPAPRIPDVEKKTDTFTAARPQPFAAAAPSGPAPAETEPEEPVLTGDELEVTTSRSSRSLFRRTPIRQFVSLLPRNFTMTLTALIIFLTICLRAVTRKRFRVPNRSSETDKG